MTSSWCIHTIQFKFTGTGQSYCPDVSEVNRKVTLTIVTLGELRSTLCTTRSVSRRFRDVRYMLHVHKMELSYIGWNGVHPLWLWNDNNEQRKTQIMCAILVLHCIGRAIRLCTIYMYWFNSAQLKDTGDCREAHQRLNAPQVVVHVTSKRWHFTG